MTYDIKENTITCYSKDYESLSKLHFKDYNPQRIIGKIIVPNIEIEPQALNKIICQDEKIQLKDEVLQEAFANTRRTLQDIIEFQNIKVNDGIKIHKVSPYDIPYGLVEGKNDSICITYTSNNEIINNVILFTEYQQAKLEQIIGYELSHTQFNYELSYIDDIAHNETISSFIGYLVSYYINNKDANKTYMEQAPNLKSTFKKIIEIKEMLQKREISKTFIDNIIHTQGYVEGLMLFQKYMTLPYNKQMITLQDTSNLFNGANTNLHMTDYLKKYGITQDKIRNNHPQILKENYMRVKTRD